MPKLKDLTGEKFGRLTVIERAENGNCKQVKWKCKCECGTVINVQSANLLRGATRSCGCLQRKHNGSRTRLYNIWSNMKSRCYDKKHKHFSSYGGRGISICDEWKNSFTAFRDWAIANGYKDTLSIDRINVNGNYCPENCRWATMKMQGNNKTDSHYITYKGKTQTIAQWAEEIGVKNATLHARITRYNWDIEKALTKK